MVAHWPIFKALSPLRAAKIAPHGAHSTFLCTPNSPKVCLEKPIFDLFLTNFWSQNSPFSRHSVTLEGPKWIAMGSKRAHFTCLCTPNGLGSFLEKHTFDPFLTHFLSQNSHLFKPFCEYRVGSKWAHFTCLCTPNGVGSCLEKHIFDPFLTHFFVPKQPIFKDFRRAKTGHHDLKARQKHLFWHSMWSMIIFEKRHFFAPGGPC